MDGHGLLISNQDSIKNREKLPAAVTATGKDGSGNENGHFN
jgi:hypothetical protein